ncbi:hypothetical protein D3C81_1854590 [compost metagenome]
MLRFIDQQRFRCCRIHTSTVVTEPICRWFKQVEHLDISLILAGIHTPRNKRNTHADTRSLRRLFNADHARQNNDIGQRSFASLFLNRFQRWQNASRDGIHIPTPLWSQRQARTIGTTTFITTTESGR